MHVCAFILVRHKKEKSFQNGVHWTLFKAFPHSRRTKKSAIFMYLLCISGENISSDSKVHLIILFVVVDIEFSILLIWSLNTNGRSLVNGKNDKTKKINWKNVQHVKWKWRCGIMISLIVNSQLKKINSNRPNIISIISTILDLNPCSILWDAI